MPWRPLINKGGSKVNKVRVRKNTETGLWQVAETAFGRSAGNSLPALMRQAE